MPKQVTLGNLRQTIRDRGEWLSPYYTDSMLNTWINESVYKFVSMMTEIEPQRFLKSANVTISESSSTATLPSDFWKAHSLSVPYALGSSLSYSLEQFDWTERHNVTEPSDATQKREHLKWTIRGGDDGSGNNTYDGYYSILFDREAGFSDTGILDYFPVIDEMDNDSDVFDTINGVGLDWIICDVCIKCAAKEETDPSVYISQKQDAEKLLVSGISKLTTEPRQQPSTENQTLGSLMRAVRSRGPWKKNDIKDADMIEWLNSSAGALTDLIISVDETKFLTQYDTNIDSGTSGYTLPTNFYKMIQVRAGDADGYEVIEEYNWNEYDSNVWDSTDVADARWHIRGNKLYIRPTPSYSGYMYWDYVAAPTKVFDPGTILMDGLYDNYWREYIILDSCVKAAISVGIDPAPWVNERNSVSGRIIAVSEKDLTGDVPTRGTNTLGALITSVRTRGNWKRKDVSDLQMVGWLNSSINGFVDLISKQDPSYYLSRYDITLVSGQNSYSLPSDFYKVQGVAYKNENEDGYSVMERYNFDERYDFKSSNDVNYLTRYNIMGSYIYFQPTPSSSGTVRLEYTPVPTALVSMTDTFDFYNGWQEWVILDCCVKMCGLTGNDPSLFMAELQKLESRIVSNSARDIGKPKTVSNVYRGLSRRNFYPGTYWRR